METPNLLFAYYAALRGLDPVVIACCLFHVVDICVFVVFSGSLGAHIALLLFNFAVLMSQRYLHVFLSDNQPFMLEKRLITRAYFDDTGSFVLNCVSFPLACYSVFFGLIVIFKLLRRIKSMKQQI